MSEYQYYEFQAIDRPLTKEQMAELRGVSSRAEITPTRFKNVYNYGDFGGNPLALMERYFDLFVYVANWGTRELMVRLPRRLLPAETTAQYCACAWLDAHLKDDHVILQFRSEEDGAEWTEGEGWLSSLLPLRDDLAAGDLRALYLGWLGCVQAGFVGGEDDAGYDLDDEEVDADSEEDEEDAADEAAAAGKDAGRRGDPRRDVVEPPVPPGLGKLSAPLTSLVEFLRIDEDLLAAAAERSARIDDAVPSSGDLEPWLLRLPVVEKDELLRRVARGESAHLQAELVQRQRRENSAGGPAPQPGGRTVGELLARAEERRNAAKERAARERERKAKEAAIKRAAFLEELAGRQEAAWQQVETLVQMKQAAAYDQAVQLLKDLRELDGKGWPSYLFKSRVLDLRERHRTKSAFLSRMKQARLLE